MESFEQPPRLTEESVKEMFNRLNPRDQLGRIMLLIGLFGSAKPSENLTLAEREDFVTNWANTEGPGLEKLAEVIQQTVSKQYQQ